jgi:hypothetical protein
MTVFMESIVWVFARSRNPMGERSLFTRWQAIGPNIWRRA